MKKCPFCAEEIQDEAIVCRYCGRDLVETPEPARLITPPAEPLAKVKKASNLPLIIFLMVIAVLGCLYIYGTSNSTSKKDNPNKDAWYACVAIIEQNLKAPTTADFESYKQGSVIANKDGSFEMIIKVDAENSFGAKIRSSYYCHVVHEGDNWRAIDLRET